MVKDEIFLIAGAPFFFAVGMSEPWKETVLNSMLFCKLYADKENRFAEGEQWSKQYAEAQAQLKWDRTEYNHRGFSPNEESTIVLKDLVEQSKMSGLIEPGHLARLMCGIESSDDPEVVTAEYRKYAVATEQESEAPGASTISLRISLVTAEPVVHSVAVSFKTAEPVEVDFLSQSFAGKHVLGKVNVEVTRHLLNKQMYEREGIRTRVLERLPANKDALLIKLPCENLY